MVLVGGGHGSESGPPRARHGRIVNSCGTIVLMSDTPSDFRSASPASPSGVEKASRASAEQPTIVTGRAPIPAPAASDSTCRILEGRVMPGDRLGHFELVEFVGGGGMGRVFRAQDTLLGRTVALKILPPEQAADADALQRFQNEAQSTARLDHDNIARAYYVGEDRGLHYIVFEFVEGMNVRALVERKGPLPLAEAISYTLQVAEALAHADARAVVHRDIKPSNVLITPDGRVKLIDMGLARMRRTDPASDDLTASGVTLGTFDYISPEQARDPRNADIRSDIYSLGCTLFYMLAGRPPFPEGTVLQKLLQHQGDPPPDIQQFRPELPEEVGRVMRKMMEKDPRRRHASPAELAADLILLADQIGLQPMSPASRVWLAPRETPYSPLRRHLPWMAPVAALVCIVLLLDRYWTISAQRDDRLAPPSAAETTDGLPSTVAAGKSAFDPPRETAKSPSTSPAANNLTPGDAPIFTPRAALSGSITPDGQLPESTIESSFLTVAEPSRSGLLIVSASPQGSDQFSTLEAACAAARDGDVIELRFNGPRADKPLKLANQHLTIRAGEGYRPIVVFRPTDSDPVKYPRSMMTLAGGRLTLSDVGIELHVPRGVPADSWSLFETWGGQQARLEHCTLTARNTTRRGATYHQDVAFFRARPAPDTSTAADVAQAATPLATLELTDCIARGEADFLRVEDVQPVQLTWDNGLLLTSQRLLYTEGGLAAPKLDETLRIELRSVTAVARGGLCRLTSTLSNPHQLTVQLTSINGVFMLSPGAALIQQEGEASIDDFRRRFLWSGARNFYQHIDAFWTIRQVVYEEFPPETMDFAAWETYWGPSREIQPSVVSLDWRRLPDPDLPLHDQTPADYSLEDPTFGDAPAGPPGCRIYRLPTLAPAL